MYRLPLRTAGIVVIKEAVADWEAAALQICLILKVFFIGFNHIKDIKLLFF